MPGVSVGGAAGRGRCHCVLSAVLKVCSEKRNHPAQGFRRLALGLRGNTVGAGAVGDELEWEQGVPGRTAGIQHVLSDVR